LAQFYSDNEDIEGDDGDDEEEEENSEELPSPSKSPDISTLRHRRRGNQSSCHGGQQNNDVTQFYSTRRLTENGRDGTVRQFADSRNNAPGKKIYDVCWLLATFRRRLMVTMFLFKLSCKIY
jgi:hypothetical protein